MLHKYKLSTRILMLGVIIVIAFCAVFGWLYPKIKGNMYDAKYLKTRHLVEAAYSVVAHYAGLAEKGTITRRLFSFRPRRPFRPCAMKAMNTSGSTT